MNLLVLYTAVLTLFSSSSVTIMDNCHSVFDIHASDSGGAVEVEMNIEKFLSLDTLTFSYNFCTNQRDDVQYCSAFRLIGAPVEDAAFMISGHHYITDYMKSSVSKMPVNSRIILEGIKYQKNGEQVYLRPLVIKLVD